MFSHKLNLQLTSETDRERARVKKKGRRLKAGGRGGRDAVVVRVEANGSSAQNAN